MPSSFPFSAAADTGNAAADDAPDQDLRLLDHPQEWSAFSRPVVGQQDHWESSVVIEGMVCAACALTVEDALRSVPGVLAASVSVGRQRARVVWTEAAVLPSTWMQAVHRSGYRALPANDALLSERRRQQQRQALWRLSVAGLCMMQVMMYALPAYVAEPGDIAPDLAQLLRWASWVLSLPVMLFSCGPFFSAAWRDVVQRRISMDLPVTLGILITFVLSTLGTFDASGRFGHEVYFDSLTMFVFFLLTGRWLELRLRDRTAGALEALMNRLPDSVERQTSDGGFERVVLRRLMIGDVLRVLPGQAFAADAVLLEGSTEVDESLLTGESHPLTRGPGGAVIAGSFNLSGVVLAQVQRTGDQTRYAQIVALMESASLEKPELARLADRIARPFLIGVLLAAGLAALFWWPSDPAHALMVAVAVLVVTCPCALSLATPAAMLAAAGTLARAGVMVRRLQAIESLSAVDTVVFDKTGTLTTDLMALKTVRTRAGVAAASALALAAALARHSLHPVSRALVAATKPEQLNHWRAENVHETAGQGISGQVSSEHDPAAPAGLLRLGSADFCALVTTPTEAGVLQVHLADAQGWLASFALGEQLRADALVTVAALRQQGLALRLLSGDTPDAVARIAGLARIDDFQGGCTPQGKLDFLRRQQQQGQRLAMVGDGINDGPVLAGAHVSFTVGRSAPLAQAQADFVVLGEQLGGLVSAVQLSHRTMKIVRQNLAWAAAYNAVCVPLAVFGYLPAWLAGLGMALSSLLVVLNALRLSV